MPIKELSLTEIGELHDATKMELVGPGAVEAENLKVLNNRVNEIARALQGLQRVRELHRSLPEVSSVHGFIDPICQSIEQALFLIGEDQREGAFSDDLHKLQWRFETFLSGKVLRAPSIAEWVTANTQHSSGTFKTEEVSASLKDIHTILRTYVVQEKVMAMAARTLEREVGAASPKVRVQDGAILLSVKNENDRWQHFAVPGGSALIGGKVLRRLFQEMYGKLGVDPTARASMESMGYESFLEKVYAKWGVSYSTNPESSRPAYSNFRKLLIKQSGSGHDREGDGGSGADKKAAGVNTYLASIRSDAERLVDNFDAKKWADLLTFNVEVFANLPTGPELGGFVLFSTLPFTGDEIDSWLS